MNPVLERYESIPAPFHVVDRPMQSVRALDAQPFDYLRTEEAIMPLWDLEIGNQTMMPAVPVGIRVRREGELFFAENDSLSVYAHGTSPEEAIADFKATAAFFAEEYRALGPDGVIGLGVQLRENFLKAFPL